MGELQRLLRRLCLLLRHGQPAGDFAETWAYLWHYPDKVAAQLSSGQSEGLRSKIRFLTDVLTKQYSAATRASLPWSGLAG